MRTCRRGPCGFGIVNRRVSAAKPVEHGFQWVMHLSPQFRRQQRRYKVVSLDLTSVRKSFIPPSVDWESPPHAETEPPRARGARVIPVARKRLRDRKNERTIMAQRNYRRTCRTYSAVQIAAAAVGAVFFLVGILGFIPGVTTNYDMLTGAGHHSGAKLLGIFEVSVLHNVVHLLFGVAGLAMARMARSAQAYLIGGAESSTWCCGSTAC